MCVKVSGTGEPFCAACKNGEAAVIPLEAEQTAFVALCGLPGLLDPADVATAFRLTSAGKPKAASVGLLELASGLPAGARAHQADGSPRWHLHVRVPPVANGSLLHSRDP